MLLWYGKNIGITIIIKITEKPNIFHFDPTTNPVRSENLVTKKLNEEKFLILEKNILRKIFGPTRDETIETSSGWRREKMQSYRLYSKLHVPIVDIIIRRRLHWTGHMVEGVRMN